MRLEVEPSLDKFSNIGGGIEENEKNKALYYAAQDLDNASQQLRVASANMENFLPAVKPGGTSSVNNAENVLGKLLDRRTNAMNLESQQGGDVNSKSQQGGDVKVITLSQNPHSFTNQGPEKSMFNNALSLNEGTNNKSEAVNRSGGCSINQLYTQDRNQFGGHNDFGSDNEEAVDEVYL